MSRNMMVLLLVTAFTAPAAHAEAILRGRVLDAQTNRRIPCTLSIRDASGRSSRTTRASAAASDRITIETRMISHEEYLQACADVCSSYSYYVGYENIYWVEEKPEWIHIGGPANLSHESSNVYNHWMASNPAYQLWAAAKLFLSRYPSQGKIAVNDMSLPFGGLFDLGAAWEPPHAQHNRGQSVDVATSGQYGIPPWQAEEFAQICREKGGTLSQNEPAKNHVHCQWP